MPASPETINILAGTPPPGRYNNAKAAAARIRELETMLGLPPGPFIARVAEFNARIYALEQLLAQKAFAPAPAVPPVAPVSPPAAPPPAAQLTAKQLLELCRLLKVPAVRDGAQKLDEPATLGRLELAAYNAHVSIPGARSDNDLAALGHRRFPREKVSRAASGITQSFINQITK